MGQGPHRLLELRGTHCDCFWEHNALGEEVHVAAGGGPRREERDAASCPHCTASWGLAANRAQAMKQDGWARVIASFLAQVKTSVGKR